MVFYVLWWHSDTTIESNSFTIHHWIVNHCQNHVSEMFWITKSFKVFQPITSSETGCHPPEVITSNRKWLYKTGSANIRPDVENMKPEVENMKPEVKNMKPEVKVKHSLVGRELV